MGKAIHEKWNFYKFLVLGTKKLIDDSPAGGEGGGGGVWTNYQIFEMRDLTGPQFLEGVGGKEGGDLFQEVSVFI